MGIRRHTRHAESLKLIEEGKWNEAHEIVQDDTDKLSCPLGGALRRNIYLHRVEGDIGNARYWYAEAGEKMPDNTSKKNWNGCLQWSMNSDQ